MTERLTVHSKLHDLPAPRPAQTLEQRVQELADREAIRELVARYAQRVPHNRPLGDLFTDDGVFILRFPGRPPSEKRGRAAIEADFQANAESRSPPMPMIHNHLISIDGDTASGLCSIEIRVAAGGQSVIGSGYYQDEYRRENGQWKFASRDCAFFHMVPIQQGWADSK